MKKIVYFSILGIFIPQLTYACGTFNQANFLVQFTAVLFSVFLTLYIANKIYGKEIKSKKLLVFSVISLMLFVVSVGDQAYSSHKAKQKAAQEIDECEKSCKDDKMCFCVPAC
jgi:preprotein translocase subunit SecG